MICVNLKLEENPDTELFHKEIRKDFYCTNKSSYALDKIPNNEDNSILPT